MYRISWNIPLFLILVQGTLCQYDLSECEELFPCQNNGTCTIDTNSANGTFICQCPVGFAGPQCELDISVCNTTENVCLNGGQCVDGVGVNFKCLCQSGWEGRLCEIEIDECISQPCENGGICVNRLNDFGCACPFGYTGKTCEKKLKICEVNPCKNGAFCLHEDEDDLKRTCYCVPDYHGELCEFKYDDCSPGPKCFNGGTCIDGVAEFACSCAPDFFGPTCQCTAENMTDPSCQVNETISKSYTIFLPYPSSTATIFTSLPFSLEMSLPIFASDSSTLLFSSPAIAQTAGFDSQQPTKTMDIMSNSLLSLSIDSTTITLDGSEIIIPSSPFTMSLFSTPVSSFGVEPSEPLQTSIPISDEMSLFSSFFESSSAVFQSLSQDEPLSSEFTVTSSIKTQNIEQSPSVQSIIPHSEFPEGGSLQVGIITTAMSSEDISSISQSERTTIISTSSVFFTATLSPDLTSTEDMPTEPTISYEFSTVILESELSSDKSLFPSASTYYPELSLNSLSPASTPILTQLVSETFSIQSSYSSIPEDSIYPITSTLFSSLQSDIATYITPFGSIVNDSIPMTSVIDTGASLSVIYIPEQSMSSPSDAFIETVTASGPLISPTQTTSYVEPSLITTSELSPTPSTVMPFTTPEPSISLPSPEPTQQAPNNGSQTDPCHNYCFNNGKCISDSIEVACICSFKYTGSRCETMRKKFNTTSFTGDSFLGYKVPNNSLNRISVKTKIATNAPDGILFYTSSSLGRLYALIFTQGGHITLHFSCGAQSMHFVETRTRVDNGHNFTLDFSMEMIVHGITEMHCVAQVSVNDSYIMRGEQIVGQNELYENPIQVIYVGGVDTGNAQKKNDDLIFILSGFRGCLYSISINEEFTDMFDDAIYGKDVSECSAFGCVSNPCFGSSKCMPWKKFPYWQCLCSPGFQGARCQVRVCDSNPCMNGATCTFPPEENHFSSNNSTEITQIPSPNHQNRTILCLCPLGFSGPHCQFPLNITKPSFKPVYGFDYSAFIAYEPIPRFTDWVQLKLHFVTRNTSQISLLLYSGFTQSLSSAISSPDELDILSELVQESSPQEITELTSNNDITANTVSDFFAITYVQGYIALTWNLGSGTQRVITPSRINKQLNVHTLYAGRAGRQAWLKVDGMRNVTGKSPGPFHRLNVNTELFIGGYEAFRFEGLPHDLPAHKGFEGCIFDFGFRVKNRLYLPRPLRGRNIKNCYEEDC